MASRRKRLALLRLFGPRPSTTTDEPNGPGMDASPESNDADRSRSAPDFCLPRQVAPQPYRPPARRQPVAPKPVVQAAPRRPPPITVAAEPRSYVEPMAAPEPRTVTAAPRHAEPREMSTPGTRSVRPFWVDADDEAEQAAPEGGEEPTPNGPLWAALARGVSLLFGSLLAVELFGNQQGLPAEGPWWLDTRPLPAKAAAGVLGLGAAVLIAYGVRPRLPGPLRAIGILSLLSLIALSLKNATVYFGLLQRGDLHAGPPVAFPLHIAACLTVVLIALASTPRRGGFGDLLLASAGFWSAALALPIAHIGCCGPIDARRPAAAIVVLGPREFDVNPDASFDRQLGKGIDLFKSGLAPAMILAGNPSGERLDRLQRLAAAGGVPEKSLTVFAGDDKALAAELRKQYPAAEGRTPDLLAVGEPDQLPRVTVLARSAGVKLSPVPADRLERLEPKTLRHELVGLWRAYLGR